MTLNNRARMCHLMICDLTDAERLALSEDATLRPFYFLVWLHTVGLARPTRRAEHGVALLHTRILKITDKRS